MFSVLTVVVAIMVGAFLIGMLVGMLVLEMSHQYTKLAEKQELSDWVDKLIQQRTK